MSAKLPPDAAALRARTRAADITLPALLRARTRLDPDALALREKVRGVWRRIRWRDYEHAVRRVALGLHALGVRAGDRVAIASENVPPWFFADLGAQSIGAQVVGIYPPNPWPELQDIVRHSGASVIFVGDQEQLDKVLEARQREGGLPALRHIVLFDTKGTRRYAVAELITFDALLALGGRTVPEPGVDAEAWVDARIDAGAPADTAVLVYTSGTTGPPKGAMIAHRNLVWAADAYAEAARMFERPFDTISYLPLCHVADRCYSMVMHLVVGGRCSFAESIDTVATNVREIAPTFFIGVPRIYEKMQQNFLFRLQESGRWPQRIFDAAMRVARRHSDLRQAAGGAPAGGLGLRLARALLYWGLFRNLHRHFGLDRSVHRLCAGASVSPEMLRFFDVVGLPLRQGYGLTESSGVVFLQDERHDRVGGAGVPLRDVQWRRLDDGEIVVRSPGNFQGYFNDEAATRATVDAEGWLHSGDIVDLLDDGEITIVDRKKAIIITSGGKNIAPSEVENALKDSPYVREAIVVGDGRKFVAALIQVDVDTVGRWARERGIAYTNYASLAALDEVRELVQQVVDAVNARFARVENVRKFVILKKELDHDDGELTATQKVRRGVIDRKFAAELAQIYGP